MKEKTTLFFEKNVELLEQFLIYLWIDPVMIKDKIIYFEKTIFIIDFIINEKEIIRMKAKVEQVKEEWMIRIKYTSHINQNFEKEESCLLLSFCYHCPNELELCNQYGLYRKQDVKELERIKDADLIHQYQHEKNLLGNNQCFIFNMKRIKEHCKDKVLDQIIHDFHHAVKKYLDPLK